ncbi:MAG: hypothetical protein ACXWDN_21615, partial [Limisphaerales bacterium]
MPNHSAKPQGKQHVDAVGYEKRDANAKGIFLAVLGLFIALALVDLIVHWIVSDFRKSPTPGDRFSGSVRQRQAAATEEIAQAVAKAMKKAGVKREGLGLPAPWGERLAEALAIAEGRHGRPPRDRRAEQARAAQAAEKPPPVAPPETSVR